MFNDTRRDTFSAVSLSIFLVGGVNASGAKQIDGPVMPRNTGNGRIVSNVIRSVYLETL